MTDISVTCREIWGWRRAGRVAGLGASLGESQWLLIPLIDWKDLWAVFWGWVLVGLLGITQQARQYAAFTCMCPGLALGEFAVPITPSSLSGRGVVALTCLVHCRSSVSACSAK